jgi:pyruvate kinase
VQPGDLVIMTVGDVVGQVGTTNTMKIIKVGSRK